MWRRALGFSVLACFSPIFAQVNPADSVNAQHDAEARKWAQKTGLPVSDVRAIFSAAGISHEPLGLRITNIDAISLKQRNQILLIEGPCVKLHVIERRGNALTEVWSLSSLPRPSWKPEAGSRPGRGICPQAPLPPSAHATADGRIVLEVPILMDAFERTLPVDTYSFAWDGAKYVLMNDER